jgi:hypothetical protein
VSVLGLLMALKRATKSIPLSGGIVEEVDDFLLEPGGMAYVENVRFPKKDQAEKTRGFAAGASTGIGLSDTLLGLWSSGNRLAVVAGDEVNVSTNGGQSFTTNDQPFKIYGIERALATAEQAGGCNFTWAPIWDTNTGNIANFYGYVVAFERVRNRTALTSNERDVIIQTYDPEGRLVDTLLREDCNTPRAKPGDSLSVIFYVTSTGRLQSRSVDSTLQIGGSTITDFNADCQLYCQEYNNTNEGWGPVGSELLFDDMRLGYARDYKLNNAAFDMWLDPQGTIGALCWKEEGTGQLWIDRHLNGLKLGQDYNLANDSGAFFNKVLDITEDATYTYALWASTNTTTLATNVFCTRLTHDFSTSILTQTVASGLGSIVVNGSVRVGGSTNGNYALTLAEGDPSDLMDIGAAGHRIQWYVYSSTSWSASTLIDSGTIYSHRLVSDIALDSTSSPYFAAQQWGNWNIAAGRYGGGNPNVPGITPTHQKPLTTVLVAARRGDNNEIVATFDAGQSKAILPTMEEQTINMGGELYYFDDGDVTSDDYNAFWYGNRVQLNVPDAFYDVNTNPGGTFPASDGKVALHPGSGRFAIYKVQKGLNVNSTSFPDGLFAGASTPVWYDGHKYLSEAAPLDSPEIVGWQSSGNAGTYLMYQDPGLSGESPKLYQALVGFYDDAGRVHRSAPSVPVYVGRTVATETTDTALTLYVSPALTLQKNRPYFVEIYEAFPGKVPQLCATRHYEDLRADAKWALTFAINLGPGSPAKDIDVVDYRNSKSLYTGDAVLAADPWPSFDFVVKNGRRLFAHSISDPSTIYYSKLFEPNVMPEFNGALTVTLGNETITAMGAIDDKLILFTENECWFLYGPGPDNTGANGDFLIEKLVYPIGCTDQDSILQYEGGIAFYSSTTQEFHTLSRDLQLVDLGENVKQLSEGITDIKTALVAPHDHELRWYCSFTNAGPGSVPDTTYASPIPQQPTQPKLRNTLDGLINDLVFVFNYKYGKWSVNRVEDSLGNEVLGNGSVVHRNRVGLVSESYVWRAESDDSWAFSEECVWETPWIKVNQLQDFGRFYGVDILARYLSSWDDDTVTDDIEAGDLQVTLSYDYEGEDGRKDVYRWRANQDFDPADGDRLQISVRPGRQKCQAIKLRIEEIPTEKIEAWEPDYTKGRGFGLVAADIHYGAKGGSGSKNLGARRRRGQ